MISGKTILKIIISLTILIILLFSAGLSDVWRVILTINPYLFLFALSITLPTMLLRFLRWKYIIEASNIKIPFIEISKIYIIGFFFGITTPSKIGNLVKIHYLHKYHNVPTSTAISLTIIERIFDIIIVAVISLIGIIFIITNFPSVVILLIFITVIFVIMILVFNETVFKRIAKFGILKINTLKRFAKMEKEINIELAINNLYKPFNQLKKMKTFILTLLISIIIWITVGFQVNLILDAMGASIGFYYTIIFMCISILVGLVPLTISGLGIREGTFAFFLSTIGVSLNIGVSASLMAFFIGQILPALFGLISYSLYKKM